MNDIDAFKATVEMTEGGGGSTPDLDGRLDGETTPSTPLYTKRQRARWTQNGLGYRPTNGWGSGDLPAPWAEGDVVNAPEEFVGTPRSRSLPAGLLVVSYATSIDEGDAWYFRVTDGTHGSDRLHVSFADRSDWGRDVDWMAGFELIDTADPDGLALRERMLADGWTYTPPPRCPSCGQRVPT